MLILNNLMMLIVVYVFIKIGEKYFKMDKIYIFK